jgi:hypothetical protein
VAHRNSRPLRRVLRLLASVALPLPLSFIWTNALMLLTLGGTEASVQLKLTGIGLNALEELNTHQ